MPEDELLKSIADLVRSDIQCYPARERPSPGSTVGIPWSDEKIAEELVKMCEALVQPFYVAVEIRDTFDQVQATDGPRRTCVVVADDKHGMKLIYDPVECDFALVQECRAGLVTFGVRGDPVGCFLAR